jgi:hypothetical protein
MILSKFYDSKNYTYTFYEIVYFIYSYNLTNFDKIIVFHNIHHIDKIWYFEKFSSFWKNVSIVFEFCHTLLVLIKFHSFDNLKYINESWMTETPFRAIAHT